MNLRAKFGFWIGLSGFLFLLLPGSLRADTVYTYTGNPYTQCSGQSPCPGTPPALSFTLDTTLTGAQLDNLVFGTTLADLTKSLISFTFTDGTGLTITQPSDLIALTVSTDGAGDIQAWFIVAADAAGTGFESCFDFPGVCFGFDGTLKAGTINSGTLSTGRWSPPVSSTPEPGAASLMLTGIGLVLVMRKRIGQGLHRAS